MSLAVLTVSTANGANIDDIFSALGDPSTISGAGQTGYQRDDPTSDLTFFFSGSNLTYDMSGNPTGGSVFSITFTQTSSDSDLVSIQFVGGVAPSALDLAIAAFQGGDRTGLDSLLGGFDYVLAGGGGNDTFTGYDKSNNLIGGAGADTLTGGTGNDTIEGGAGADHLDGGAGNNTLSYESDTTGINVLLINDIVSGGDAAGDVISHFQNVTGGSGSDSLLGDGGANILQGGDGSDVLQGGAGPDTIDGGAGNDFALYELSTLGVTITLGGGGAQTIGHGGDAEGDKIIGIENVYGSNTGNDVLTGNELANVLYGETGDDTLNGAGGNDLLKGGKGADTLIGGAGVDQITYIDSATGVTVALGANGAQTIGHGGDAEGDKISVVENIEGSDFNDVLTGNNLANFILGGQGDDVIQGGAGADVLNGEPAAKPLAIR